MGNYPSTIVNSSINANNAIYSLIYPKVSEEDGIENENNNGEVLVKFSSEDGVEHTLALKKSESNKSIEVICDGEDLNSIKEILDNSWVIVDENEEENKEKIEKKEKNAGNDNDEEEEGNSGKETFNFLSDIKVNVTQPKAQTNDKTINEKVEEIDQMIEIEEWVVVDSDIDENFRFKKATEEVDKLKETIAILQLQIETLQKSVQFTQSILYSSNLCNNNNYNNNNTNNNNNIINMNNVLHHNIALNNNSNLLNLNNNHHHNMEVNKTEETVVSMPTLPPPPPPPLPSNDDLKQYQKIKTTCKNTPKELSEEEIIGKLRIAIEKSDIQQKNYENAVKNYLNSFKTEKARKFLAFMVTHYEQLISSLPLRPKTCFELISIWEKHLFSKIENIVERNAIRSRKMMEIKNKREESEILAEIDRIFKFIESQKIQARDAKKHSDSKKKMQDELELRLLQRRQNEEDNNSQSELSTMETVNIELDDSFS